MPKKIVLWKCKYCDHASSDRDIIVRHESICYLNPAMKVPMKWVAENVDVKVRFEGGEK